MSDHNTAKYLNKQMKARGLQKLKFYCQVCHKQCRDDNGFQSHIKSPSHLRNISKVTTKDIDKYSQQFEEDFLLLLKLSHGEKYIVGNKFYNEFIQDKDHIHMNATRFTSLSKFIKYLSKEGKIRIKLDEEVEGDEVDMGQLQISYIDRSQGNVMRQQMLADLESTQRDEQEIKNMLLQRQMALAKNHQKVENKKEPKIVTTTDVQDIKLNVMIPTIKTKKKVIKKKKKGGALSSFD